VTARGQVRDDGQTGASRARGDQRPQEAGFFAGSRYILPRRPAGRPMTNGSGVSIRQRRSLNPVNDPEDKFIFLFRILLSFAV
jgi:hypothetical protein